MKNQSNINKLRNQRPKDTGQRLMTNSNEDLAIQKMGPFMPHDDDQKFF